MNQIQKFFDRITFKQTFIFWILFMVVFGMIYFILSFSENNDLLYNGERLKPSISGFFTAQYFSFITAASASQGYGDIFPVGWARVFAVIEAVCGLLLFGVLITKLVSVKQERILDEIYAISFDEKIHRIRSAFYLFRIEVNKILQYFETNFSKKQFSILSSISSFSISLDDTYNLICINKEFSKNIDDVRLELLIISIERSFLKLVLLLQKLDSKKVDWRNDLTIQKIKLIIRTSYLIHKNIKSRDINDKMKSRLENIKESITGLEKFS